MRVDDVFDDVVVNVEYEVMEAVTEAVGGGGGGDDGGGVPLVNPETAETGDLVMVLSRELWKRIVETYQRCVTPLVSTDLSEYVPMPVLQIAFFLTLAFIIYQIWRMITLAKLKRKVL